MSSPHMPIIVQVAHARARGLKQFIFQSRQILFVRNKPTKIRRVSSLRLFLFFINRSAYMSLLYQTNTKLTKE